jgi:hypothetical protein
MLRQLLELLCCGSIELIFVLGFALLLTTNCRHLYTAAFCFVLTHSSLAFTLLLSILLQLQFVVLRFEVLPRSLVEQPSQTERNCNPTKLRPHRHQSPFLTQITLLPSDRKVYKESPSVKKCDCWPSF